jgi:hypothetical protein
MNRHSPRFGIRHLTVVPTNYEPPATGTETAETSREDTDGGVAVPSEG